MAALQKNETVSVFNQPYSDKIFEKGGNFGVAVGPKYVVDGAIGRF